MPAKLTACQLVLLLVLTHTLCVGIFLRGFLLSRVELPNISTCCDPELSAEGLRLEATNKHDTDVMQSGCWSEPAFDRALVVIVDALRYDSVFGDSISTKGYMPMLTGLLADAASAGAAFKFVADTPTITMSRLKAILTGGLPTFLDIGQSFSAAAINEDNLLGQLSSRGARVVVLGDDTWAQLAAPSTYAGCHTFPSFDVRDLHTVDEGVWQHLMPYLRPGNSSSRNNGRSSDRNDSSDSGSGSSSSSEGADAGDGRSRSRGGSIGGSHGGRGGNDGGGGSWSPGWEVLVAHYLGVDHAGHTYGGNSQEMYDKLRQMDEQISAVAEELLTGAAEGEGPYGRTLLLVFGDHGQTMSGDHGGGSDEERDSALLAFNLGAWRKARDARSGAAAAAAATTAATEANPAAADPASPQRLASERASIAPPAATAAVTLADQTAQAEAWQAPPGLGGVAVEAIPQIDLTPTLALLLGLPIPFGNLGKVNRRLWEVAHGSVSGRAGAVEHGVPRGGSGGPGGGAPPASPSYVAALRANAVQVDRYLRTYAALGGLPARELAHCASLLRTATALHQAHLGVEAAATAPRKEASSSRLSARAASARGIGERGAFSEGEGAECRADSGGSRCTVDAVPSAAEVEKEHADAGATGTAEAPTAAKATGPDATAAGWDYGCGGDDAAVPGASAAAEDAAAGMAAAAAAFDAFLEAAGALARRKFTRFDLPAMAVGCVLCVLCCVGLHAWLLGRLCSWRVLASPTTLTVAVAAVVHAMGLFSANWIQGEGRIHCYTLAAATLLLWLRATLDVASGTGTAALPSPAARFETAGGRGSNSAASRGGGGAGDGREVGIAVVAVARVAAAAGVRGVMGSSDGAAKEQQQRGRWQGVWLRQARLVLLAAVALACNLLLQRYSLIDRWGSDPHDKRQLAAAAADPHGPTGLPADGDSWGVSGRAAVWGISYRVLAAAVETLAPLLLLPLLLRVLLVLSAGQLQQPAAAAAGGAAGPLVRAPLSERRRSLTGQWPWRWLRLATHYGPYPLVSAWWALQLLGSSSSSGSSSTQGGDGGGSGGGVGSESVGTGTVSTEVLSTEALVRSGWHLLSAAAFGSAPCVALARAMRSFVDGLGVLTESAPVAVALKLAWGIAQKLLPTLWAAVHHPAVQWLVADVTSALRLPLRLLLPRLVYGLAAAALARVAAARLWVQWWRQQRLWRRQRLQRTELPGKEPQAAADAEAEEAAEDREEEAMLLDACHAVVSSGTAVVALLLGRRGPAVLLMLWAQGACLMGLMLSCPGPRRRGGGGSGQRGLRNVGVGDGMPAAAGSAAAATATAASVPPAAAAAAASAVAGGCLLSLLGGQAFFLTGHFCEFSGLQYDSPFVGFDHMTWPATPLLFWLNSFGALMLPALALPLAAAAATTKMRTAASHAPRARTVHPNVDHAAFRDDNAVTPHIEPSSGAEPPTPFGSTPSCANSPCTTSARTPTAFNVSDVGRVMLLSLSACRSCALSAAVLSAAIQRHHVVVWALFAPKLVFEVCFAAAAYAALAAAGMCMM